MIVLFYIFFGKLDTYIFLYLQIIPTSPQTATTIPQHSSSADTSNVSDEGLHLLDEATSSETLANTKEKTPMCLVNELARFNKVRLMTMQSI
jgi:hypothetical protein